MTFSISSTERNGSVGCQFCVQSNTKEIMEENHAGPLDGHYSGNQLYNTLSNNWYWDEIYTDAVDLEFCKPCPQYAIVSGRERHVKQPLHPIPAQRYFQIIGLDIMDLPMTKNAANMWLSFRITSLNGPWSLLCQIRKLM